MLTIHRDRRRPGFASTLGLLVDKDDTARVKEISVFRNFLDFHCAKQSRT